MVSSILPSLLARPERRTWISTAEYHRRYGAIIAAVRARGEEPDIKHLLKGSREAQPSRTSISWQEAFLFFISPVPYLDQRDHD
jgi:hypothetical protein